MFERCQTKNLKRSLKQHIKYFNFRSKVQLDRPVLHTLLCSFTFPPSLPVAPFVESFSFPRNLTRGKRLRVICTVTEGDRPLEVE